MIRNQQNHRPRQRSFPSSVAIPLSSARPARQMHSQRLTRPHLPRSRSVPPSTSENNLSPSGQSERTFARPCMQPPAYRQAEPRSLDPAPSHLFVHARCEASRPMNHSAAIGRKSCHYVPSPLSIRAICKPPRSPLELESHIRKTHRGAQRDSRKIQRPGAPDNAYQPYEPNSRSPPPARHAAILIWPGSACEPD